MKFKILDLEREPAEFELNLPPGAVDTAKRPSRWAI
jgi:hypothetical protein